MMLANVKKGSRVCLECVSGGCEFRSHLASMGLLPGVTMFIVREGLMGSFIVEIDGCRIVIGRGLAEKIEVK